MSAEKVGVRRVSYHCVMKSSTLQYARSAVCPSTAGIVECLCGVFFPYNILMASFYFVLFVHISFLLLL